MTSSPRPIIARHVAFAQFGNMAVQINEQDMVYYR
jgi:hypothetical protein